MPVWRAKPSFLSISTQSILEQKFSNLELLIVYEKSSEKIDESLEKIFEENSDDHRLKIIKSNEKGLANSLNLGLTKAKGQYIARMDSDDISEKNRLEEQISFIKESNNDLVGILKCLIPMLH